MHCCLGAMSDASACRDIPRRVSLSSSLFSTLLIHRPHRFPPHTDSEWTWPHLPHHPPHPIRLHLPPRLRHWCPPPQCLCVPPQFPHRHPTPHRLHIPPRLRHCRPPPLPWMPTLPWMLANRMRKYMMPRRCHRIPKRVAFDASIPANRMAGAKICSALGTTGIDIMNPSFCIRNAINCARMSGMIPSIHASMHPSIHPCSIYRSIDPFMPMSFNFAVLITILWQCM